MTRNDHYPMMSSSKSSISKNNNGFTSFEINDYEGVDIINSILYGINFPLRIKSFNECVSSLWVVLYEGLYRTRLDGIIRGRNAEFTEAKIMNIQTILNQLKNQYGIPFPSKMAYELFSGNRTYIMKFIYLFKILFDCTSHDQGQDQIYNDFKFVSNKTAKNTYSNNQYSIPSIQAVQEELQKYLPILLDGETESGPSQNQSIEKISNKASSVKSNQNLKVDKGKTIPTATQSIKNNKEINSSDMDEKPIKIQKEKIYDHVNLEDSQLNFLLNSDNYPLNENGTSTRLSNPKSTQSHVKDNRDVNFSNNINKNNYPNEHDHYPDDAVSTTSTQKSFKSNRTRSGTNKYITLNDDIYRYIISNKINEGGGPGQNQIGGRDIGIDSIHNEKPMKIAKSIPSSSSKSSKSSKSKNNLKKKPSSPAGLNCVINKNNEKTTHQNSNTNINTKTRKTKLKDKVNSKKTKKNSNKTIIKPKKFTFSKDYISGCSEKIQQNHREIESLKNEFSFLQSQYQSLTNDLHSLHTHNPNGMMEAHRMETYLKNFKTYTMTIEQKDPLVEQLRHCKFFHYIGKDHNMQLLKDTELNELDERLKKKKALLDKIMNEDPTLLNEMKNEFILETNGDGEELDIGNGQEKGTVIGKKKFTEKEFQRRLANSIFEKRRKTVAIQHMQQEINQILNDKQNIMSFNKSLEYYRLLKKYKEEYRSLIIERNSLLREAKKKQEDEILLKQENMIN